MQVDLVAVHLVKGILKKPDMGVKPLAADCVNLVFTEDTAR